MFKKNDSNAIQNIASEDYVLITLCTGGYGNFENTEYNCGWKAGYDDWVFQYNTIIGEDVLSKCYIIKVI